ncbi:MAG: cation diffusion facilitator family transporter [Pseudomonadota bacterium]|nr:cation diffusion facilitator family transporter [Pseudomonadota bacterium]
MSPTPPISTAHDHGHAAHEHGHGHDHGHLRTPGNERRIVVMLALVVGYIFVELFGGLWSGSLALLADAGHMTSDAAALAIALFALRMARRPPTATRTYGFHRAEVLAAVVNGGALVAVALGILWEAAQRLSDPAPVVAPVMMAVAAGGLVVNLLGLAVLAGGRHQDMNLRGAWLHVLSDALGSVGALVAGALVWWKGWTWADPVASAAIALLVLHASYALLNEAVHVLMEGAPAHIDVGEVRAVMCGTPGVQAVHDLHVWTITSGMVAMSGHVVVDGTVDGHELLGTLAASLRSRFSIGHTTIQLEPVDFVEEGFHP